MPRFGKVENRVLASWPGAPCHLADGDFDRLVGSIRFAFDPFFTRKALRLPSDQLPTTMGGSFVKAPELRLCAESEDKLAHIAQASSVPFPSDDSRGAYRLPPDIKMVIRCMMELGLDLGAFRQRQLEVLRDLAQKARPFDARLKAWAKDAPAHVKAVANKVHVGLMVIMLEAFECWPDTLLPYGFLVGFDVVGSLQDSGVFRPIADGRSPEIFEAEFRAFQQDNKTWAREVYRKVQASYERAKSKGASSPEWEALQQADALTVKETMAGTMLPGMSLPELEYKYTASDGAFKARVIQRFAVQQGFKTAVNERGEVRREPKWRAIDDAKRSRTNDMCRPCETIHLPTFKFPGLVAQEVAAVAEELGVPTPPLRVGVDDLRAGTPTSGSRTTPPKHALGRSRRPDSVCGTLPTSPPPRM